MPHRYLVLALKYNDPVIKEELSQVFFLKWLGTIKGKVDMTIVEVITLNEKQRITDYLNEKDLLQEFLQLQDAQ